MAKKRIGLLEFVFLALIAFLLIAHLYDFNRLLQNAPAQAIVQYLPSLINNGLLVFIPMLFGGVLAKQTKTWRLAAQMWIVAVASLLGFHLVLWLINPQQLVMWQVFGIFLPVTTSTSMLLSGILFSLLAFPALKRLKERLTLKQNLLVLVFFTFMCFSLSAGMLAADYSIYGLYLILPFYWGMVLRDVKLSAKQLAGLLVLGAIALLIILIGVPGIVAVNTIQRSDNVNMLPWNGQFLTHQTSPLLFLVVISVFFAVKGIVEQLTARQLQYMTPLLALFGVASTGQLFWTWKINGSIKYGLLLVSVTFMLLLGLWQSVWEMLFAHSKRLSQFFAYLDQQTSLIKLLEDGFEHLRKFVSKHRVNLLTWLVFACLSLASFVIVSDHFRIQSSTSVNLNVLVYIFSFKLFAVVLTTIFLDALFTILYFVTTRYWTSVILTGAFSIGWAVANKIKLDLRGEPIYPTDLNEAGNIQSLANMVGKSTVVIILAALAALLLVLLVLEIKVKIKRRGTWRRRGIWAVLSALLFVTPLYYNHEGTPIYYLVRAFDNKSGFRNPERDVQTNGPLLSFMNYIDLQIMKRPAGYSQQAITQLYQKYAKVAKEINATRSNKLKDQTIVMNLSESYVDPAMFPTVKFAAGLPNPAAFVQSMQKHATYGKMLSAGYGGGTANMEWESLTGLNMGLFDSSITPYVQVVSRFKFYPTIGMNFNYASAIHPYMGSYYSRIEDYRRFGFNKFAYVGSRYKIIDQHTIDKSSYNSDQTAYANALKQVNSQKHGQFINLISMQNHMPYNNWYYNNEYVGKVSGKLLDSSAAQMQMATYSKGIQYTDKAVKAFIRRLDQINKPITLIFYGDHYPAIIDQSATSQYPLELHQTRYFIYSNKYARNHGAKAKLDKGSVVNTSDFIAMLLEQTNSKVTPYQALLTKVHQELPAITINYTGTSGFELVDENGKVVDQTKLTNDQKALLEDYKLIQYDLTAGDGKALKVKGFLK